MLYHWKEESQHAILDELEWIRENAKLTAEQRGHAVDELTELVGAVGRILEPQSDADTRYFLTTCGRSFGPEAVDQIQTVILKAYRWQFIISGIEQPRFIALLTGMITETQRRRINEALARF